MERLGKAASFSTTPKAKDIRVLLVDRAGRIWIRRTERLYRLESFEAPPVAVTVPEPLSMVNHFSGRGRVRPRLTNTRPESDLDLESDREC